MFTETLHIPASNELTLFADIVIPDKANSIVIFSHGSGSSRFLPRLKHLAAALHKEHIATLLPDLLTLDEDKDYDKRFDIPLLTKRMTDVTRWVSESAITSELAIDYLGVSTGAGAALSAAARLGSAIKSVACCGGRPDLAISELPMVKCPVLLIVGSLDMPLMQMNQEAYLNLDCMKELVLVQNATHFFEEPGKLEEAGKLAADWFNGRYIQKHSKAA